MSGLDDDNNNDDDDNCPPLAINFFPSSWIQQPNVILNLRPPSSPDLDDNNLNQAFYPSKFDNVLGELVMERQDIIKLSEKL